MQDSHSDLKSLESYLGEVVGTKVEALQIDTRRQDGCTAHLITLDYFVDYRSPTYSHRHNRTFQRTDSELRTHTAVVLEDESIDLPEFTLHSRAGISTKVKWNPYGPGRDLTFLDVSAFEKNLNLGCWKPEDISRNR